MTGLDFAAAQTTQAPPFHQKSSYLRVRGALLATILAICIVIGVTLKAVTVLAAWRQRKGRLSALSWLVISLMAAGMLHLLLVVPFQITEVAHPTWSFGDAFCKAYEYQKFVYLYAIAWHLVLVCTYLMIEVLQPQAAGKMDRPRTMGLVLGLAWAVLFLANIPHVYGHGTLYIARAQRTYCYAKGFHDDRRTMQQWGVVNFIFLFLLPAILMIIASAILCWKILMVRAGRQGLLDPSMGHRDFSITVTCLTVTFTVLWGVPRIQSLLQVFAAIDPHHVVVRDVGSIFLHGLLPVLLPLIFLLGVREYRQVITCCGKKGNAAPHNGLSQRSGNCALEEEGTDNPDEDAKL